MATAGLANTACIELDGSPSEGWRVVSWFAEPIGGAFLADDDAPDPTGHAVDGDEGPHQN
jgi:hypothetical protein